MTPKQELERPSEVTWWGGMYSTMTVVNNSVLVYLKVAKGVDLKNSPLKKGSSNWLKWSILTKRIMVIISQSIHISHHYVEYLEVVPCWMDQLYLNKTGQKEYGSKSYLKEKGVTGRRRSKWEKAWRYRIACLGKLWVGVWLVYRRWLREGVEYEISGVSDGCFIKGLQC